MYLRYVQHGLWLKAYVSNLILEKFNLISFFTQLMEHSF